MTMFHLDFRPLPWNASVRTHSCWTLSNLVLEFAKVCWETSREGSFVEPDLKLYCVWCLIPSMPMPLQTGFVHPTGIDFGVNGVNDHGVEAFRCSDVSAGWTRHAQWDDTRQDAASLEGGLRFGDLHSVRAEDFLGGTMRCLISNDYSIPKPPWRYCNVWWHI